MKQENISLCIKKMNRLMLILCYIVINGVLALYFTCLINEITLTTNLQRAFIWLYFDFIFMVGLYFLIKKISAWNKLISKMAFLIIIVLSFISTLIIGPKLIPMNPRLVNLNLNISENRNDKSNGNEVWLTSIVINGEKVNLHNVTLDGTGWIYKDNIIFGEGNSDIKNLNLSFLKVKTMDLTIVKHQWSGIISIDSNGIMKSYDLYDEKGGILTINIPIKNNAYSGILNNVLYLGIFEIFCLLYYSIILLIKISNYKEKYLNIVICNINRLLNQMNLFIKMILIILNFIFAFSFVGYDIFLPIQKTTICFFDLLRFFIVYIASFFIVIFLLSYVNIISNKIINILKITLLLINKTKKNLIFIYGFLVFISLYSYSLTLAFLVVGCSVILIWLTKKLKDKIYFKCFVINLLILIPILIIYNPGCLSPDSIDQLQQIMTNNYSDHHPVMHTLFEKYILICANNNVIGITFVQMIFFALVNSKCAKYLYQKNTNKTHAYIYIILTAIFPGTLINLVTLWKDIPFTISLLWLLVLLAEIKDDTKSFISNRYKIMQLFAALFIVSTFRHNGPLILLGIGLLLLIISLKKQVYKLAVLTVLILIMIISSKKIIYDQLDVKPNGNIISVVPLHGIAYLYYMNTNISQETNEYMEKILPISHFKKLYNPYNANSYMYSDIANQYSTLEKLRSLNLRDVIWIYLDSLKKYPYLLIKDRLYGLDLLWNVKQGEGGYDFKYTTEIVNNNFDIKRIPTLFMKKSNQVLKYTEKLDVIFWRGGLYLDLLLFIILVSILNKKSIIFTASPIIINIISLLPSMAWQDFRYIWFLPFSLPFLFFCSISFNDCEVIENDKYL